MAHRAHDILSAGKKVAVLNMANAFKPGGGFRGGAGAQEETLHRRTDLYRLLEAQRPDKLYPIPNNRCLLSNDVTSSPSRSVFYKSGIWL